MLRYLNSLALLFGWIVLAAVGIALLLMIIGFIIELGDR